MYFTGNQRLSDQALSYSVESPRGSKLKLSLPDGTSVWLNADSKLLYDNNFGINNRDVTLCGEGYFEVSKNKNLPFQVIPDDIKVEVLGTKFNVKNYPEDPNIKVALLEGSVMLYDSLESTILKPNQIAQYDKQNKKTTLKTIEAEKYKRMDKRSPVFRRGKHGNHRFGFGTSIRCEYYHQRRYSEKNDTLRRLHYRIEQYR